MGTLSSLTGGGSGGGGGDPQATFQAASNISNGDLVALKTNGTVEPIYSTDNAADFTISNDGTKVYAGGTTYFAGPACWAVHNEATDRYLFVRNEGGGNFYNQISQGTYDDSTNEFTLQDSNQWSAKGTWLSSEPSPNNSYMFGYGDPSQSRVLVRGIYWNGSNYVVTSDTSFGYSTDTYAVYCSANGFNSVDFTIASFSTSNEFQCTHGTYVGTSTAPTNTTDSSNRKYTSAGGFWNTSVLSGINVQDDYHLFALKESSAQNMRLVMVQCNSTTTTFGSSLNLGVTESGNYPTSLAFDPVLKVGVLSFRGSNGKANFRAFTYDTSSLTVTDLGALTTNMDGNVCPVSFNKTARKFITVDQDGGQVDMYSLAADGTQSTIETGQVHPSASNMQLEMMHVFERQDDNNMGVVFNSGTNPTSNYIDTGNHLYATQFTVPYVDTNVDNYFGEAKEAITSGSAGAVAILNRTTDFAGSSFQKGQKLFANPSGSALATSGTYRVGYATDGDTILVTGDPS